MKRIINHNIKWIACVSTFCLFASCNDFLDREPLTQITPDAYLTEESQLAAYAINLYPGMFASGLDYFTNDNHTDNMASSYGYDNRYVPGEWKTGQTGGNWSFSTIYSCNYFLDRVVPEWEAGKISGNAENTGHYIGEIYFLRAYEYFKKYQEFGDFPIIRNVLPDRKEPLIEASKRYPRNEVARFILSDLDSAIMLLKPVSPDGKNLRISSYTAQLVKSRVALFEATWLKYFNGTPFVPNGPEWPGKSKDYNASYQFPSGSIEGEIDFFLTQAMTAARVVADNIPLVENNGVLQQTESDPVNPYYDLYTAVDLSGYPEILLW
ncbi:MAG: RagB/SusD family nutrient uptake outer membrane protein, partial [Tannerellaceae bacterium]|nr:RagB/SusD family nutrient uptake outer membrane protein [Tannerellaceae bacterium]